MTIITAIYDVRDDVKRKPVFMLYLDQKGFGVFTPVAPRLSQG